MGRRADRCRLAAEDERPEIATPGSWATSSAVDSGSVGRAPSRPDPVLSITHQCAPLAFHNAVDLGVEPGGHTRQQEPHREHERGAYDRDRELAVAIPQVGKRDREDLHRGRACRQDRHGSLPLHHGCQRPPTEVGRSHRPSPDRVVELVEAATLGELAAALGDRLGLVVEPVPAETAGKEPVGRR